jgi:hypothetical protein
MKRMLWILPGFLVFTVTCGQQSVSTLRDALKGHVDTVFPAICRLMHTEPEIPPEITTMDRDGLIAFLKAGLTSDYPDNELTRRSKALSTIGILPDGFDLEQQLIELLTQQAGGLYDFREKKVIWMEDLAGEDRRGINDKMVLSHELTHAFQDRYLDFSSRAKEFSGNMDAEYAFRALIEGMASLVMMAYASGIPLSAAPDLKEFWRSGYYRGVRPYETGNDYLREYLISPYAEGGSFLQSWIKDHPGTSLRALFLNPPQTSEQVLHYEKYLGQDKPLPVPLDSFLQVVPGGWQICFQNTLGEFDLWQLFQTHGSTRDQAASLAAGWDGCDFICFETPDKQLVLVAKSAWDTPGDANEFREALSGLLVESTGANALVFSPSGSIVCFLVGLPESPVRSTLANALAR